MSARSLRIILLIAVSLMTTAFAFAGERHRHARAKPNVDPAAPYKADRLSSSRGQTILDTPGQTTVLTREVLDDMNATTLRDAMRATAGVTVGR